METKALAPVDALAQAIDKMEGDFKILLPDNVTPAKFVRCLKTAVRMNPKLVACNRQGLYSEAMKCAADGLLPDGREAALVPFKDEAKYMPMVAGICKRARNSGEIIDIDALTVYSNDTYEAWTDEKGAHFKHVKARSDRGELLLTYAYARTRDGGFYFEEVEKKVLDTIKKQAKEKSGGKSTPWDGPFEDEMRRKTALHRLGKYRIPSSSDIEEVIRRDDDLYPESEKESEPEKPSTTPKRTRDIIEAQAETVETAPPAEEPPI